LLRHTDEAVKVFIYVLAREFLARNSVAVAGGDDSEHRSDPRWEEIDKESQLHSSVL